MDMATECMISRKKIIPCVMMHMVIDRVKWLVNRQGHKTLTFFNLKKKYMLLSNAEMLKVVRVYVRTVIEDEGDDFTNFGNLPIEGKE